MVQDFKLPDNYYDDPIARGTEPELINGRCEDFPCCGHTDADPCAPQEYDRPGYYDTTIRGNEHNLCNHEEGECNFDGYDDDDEWEDED